MPLSLSQCEKLAYLLPLGLVWGCLPVPSPSLAGVEDGENLPTGLSLTAQAAWLPITHFKLNLWLCQEQ